MKGAVTLTVATLLTGLWAGGALAHDDTAGALGQVHFPTSCAAPAQPVFERGVAVKVAALSSAARPLVSIASLGGCQSG